MSTIQSSENARQVEKLSQHGYLFGKKITKSWSPYLHQLVYEELGLNWAQLRLDSADIEHFVALTQHPKFYGASVTMPNKVPILPYLDEMTEECRDVGACNTLFLRHGEGGRRLLCGANTDVIGIRDSFYYNVETPDDVFHRRPALVIGGGGAARSAIYALRKWMHVKDIYLVNRDAAETNAMIEDCTSRGYGAGLKYVATLDEAHALEAPGAIVGCIPDLEPKTPDEALARDIADVLLAKLGSRRGAMLEMCYNPTPFTRLSRKAAVHGWQVILGTEALIWQGLQQDMYWTGRSAAELPVSKVQRAIAEQLSQHATAKL